MYPVYFHLIWLGDPVILTQMVSLLMCAVHTPHISCCSLTIRLFLVLCVFVCLFVFLGFFFSVDTSSLICSCASVSLCILIFLIVDTPGNLFASTQASSKTALITDSTRFVATFSLSNLCTHF